ncbi:MAG: peptidylprolyl isomerase [Actinomycetota bacterium]|nr:peptidylprolyl isomerase [Actinomycetota bacterium]
MATDKRARKREARAEREAALRRRRNTRLAVLAGLIALLVGLAIFAGRDDGGDGEPVADATEAPGGVACGGESPPPADPQQYDAPERVLEEGVDYGAVISTSCGDITIDLYEDDYPTTVNNFVFLASEGFYDGLTFHRIVSNFVIQGGDPEGTGRGGPGYAIEDEFPAQGNIYRFGIVAMANSGPGTTGSQFFIVTHLSPDGSRDPAGLDPAYSLVGEVDRASWDVIREINGQETLGGNDPNTADRPVVPVYINSVEITTS